MMEISFNDMDFSVLESEVSRAILLAERDSFLIDMNEQVFRTVLANDIF